MNISNVWKRRLTSVGDTARNVGFVLLVITASVEGISLVWRVLSPPPPPPIASVSRQVINQTDPVKAFAADCVKRLLTATSAESKYLTRCFPGGRPYTLPATAPMTVSNPTAYACKPTVVSDELTVYGVMVQVDEQPFASAPTETAYYQLPVAVYRDKGMQALDHLSAIDPPPAGVALPLGYPVAIPTNSELFTMLSGFTSAFLTTSGELHRFITTDSGISLLGRFSSATLTTAQTEAEPPEDPADDTELAAHIDVSARRPDYSVVALSYALTLRSVGGTWFVAQIDAIPVMADTTPTPIPTTPPAPH